jgi:predicted nucleic acid-binding protein
VTAYLNASAILPTLIDEADSAAVDQCIFENEDLLVISEFAPAEVASALSRLVRTGLLTLGDARDRLEDFDAWRAASAIGLDFPAADMRLAHIFVRRFDLGLRAPDALHTAACRHESLTLTIQNKRLAAAANALRLAGETVGCGLTCPYTCVITPPHMASATPAATRRRPITSNRPVFSRR